MDSHSNDKLPPELADIADQLTRQRAQMTPLEIDRAWSRVRRTPNRRRPLQAAKGNLLRTRLALTTMLLSGLLLTGGGGALALSGDSGSGNAARSQYCPPGSQNGQGGQNTNSENATGRRCGQQGVGGREASGDDGTLGGGSGGGGGGTGDVQAARQTEVAADDSGNLPFTGYAAIPIILVGLMLLSMSLLVRRQAGRLRTD